MAGPSNLRPHGPERGGPVHLDVRYDDELAGEGRVALMIFDELGDGEYFVLDAATAIVLARDLLDWAVGDHELPW